MSIKSCFLYFIYLCNYSWRLLYIQEFKISSISYFVSLFTSISSGGGIILPFNVFSHLFTTRRGVIPCISSSLVEKLCGKCTSLWLQLSWIVLVIYFVVSVRIVECEYFAYPTNPSYLKRIVVALAASGPYLLHISSMSVLSCSSVSSVSLVSFC